MSFDRDYDWQWQYLDTVKAVIGPYLLDVSSFEIDTREATDLLVLLARDMRIGCRIRRAGYADAYPYEFTLRSLRRSGAKTELAKITDGWGDWLFYGHAADEPGAQLARWFLVDLYSWRAQQIRSKQRAGHPAMHVNRDGVTAFTAFDLRRFGNEPPILVASSHAVPTLGWGQAA